MSAPRLSDAERLEVALILRRRLAEAALLWERLWPALWPALGTLGVFLAVSLLGLWTLLPGWLHLAFLAAFGAALAIALWRGFRRFSLPSAAAARRRLERESGLVHRPLTVLEDRLASDRDDPSSRALWRLHQARAAAVVASLKVGLPRAGLARHDPWGVRAAVVLLLLVGASGAGSDWSARLAQAFAPDLSGAPAVPAELDAWITPPEYTGLPPLLLEALADPTATLTIPAGSTLLARVNGGGGAPVARLDARELAFESVDSRAHRLSAQIEAGERLAIVQDGRELGAWALDVVPDRVPAIEFATPPARTPRATLRLDYEARDDYGLAGARLEIRREGGADVVTVDLVLPGADRKHVHETGFHDFTTHPWAGVPVTLQLAADDDAKQTGRSDEFAMVLPERIFNHPVARALVEQRKALTLDPDDRERVVRALDALSELPEQFFDDLVAFMGMRMARWRLVHDREPEAIASVQQILWDTALRIEDGAVSLAERDLREAQQALMDALAGEASDEELERLMDELREALDRFLAALAEQAQQLAERNELESFDPDAMVLEGEDLKRLLDRAQELARSGARDAARELLAQLQELLQNLRQGNMFAMPQPGNDSMQQALKGLGDLMRRQQELMDQTFRESQRALRGEQTPSEANRGMAVDQESLRRALGEIMRRLGEGQGEIPMPFGKAERSMRDARRALEGNEPGEAVGPQGQALDQLRQGAQSLVEQMMQQMGQGQGQAGLGRFNRGLQDPLGRPLEGSQFDGGLTGGKVEIPDKAAVERARQILDELYRRAGQRQRPPLELEYIERLLRRF